MPGKRHYAPRGKQTPLTRAELLEKLREIQSGFSSLGLARHVSGPIGPLIQLAALVVRVEQDLADEQAEPTYRCSSGHEHATELQARRCDLSYLAD